MTARTACPPFREGDECVLATGTHEGTPGVFLRLRPDVNWAEITERDGVVRTHPVVWLAHTAAAIPVRSNELKETT